MNRKDVQAYSIFGQIEEVAATIMVERGQAMRIEPKDIPAEVLYNDAGTIARFAIWFHDRRRGSAILNELIKDLRA